MPLYLPNAKRSNTHLAELYTIDGFLNSDECRRLVAIMRSNLRLSMTTGGKALSTYRTSKTADLGLLNHPFVQEIDRRICKYMGLSRALSEPIQGQYYEPKEEYKAHTDYFKRKELPRYARRLGQRTYTFMVYLNDCRAGGNTEFVKLGLRFKPRKGQAVVWNNLRSGVPNPATRHRALPVLHGSKAILTKWFRSGRRRSVFLKDKHEVLPAHTKIGFGKRPVPKELFRKLLDWYRQSSTPGIDESKVRHLVNSNTRRRPSLLLELPQTLKDEITRDLTPIMEDWAAVPVQPTYVYGVRIYRRSAVLKPHRDRLRTHILGIIINLDQRATNPWPLEIEDHYYRKHEVFLRPGEMLLYESARLRHSRTSPFQGEIFANIFCHFVPIGLVDA